MCEIAHIAGPAGPGTCEALSKGSFIEQYLLRAYCMTSPCLQLLVSIVIGRTNQKIR